MQDGTIFFNRYTGFGDGIKFACLLPCDGDKLLIVTVSGRGERLEKKFNISSKCTRRHINNVKFWFLAATHFGRHK